MRNLLPRPNRALGTRPTGLLAAGRRGWDAFEAKLGGHVSNVCSDV
jgi:hypothetical protein